MKNLWICIENKSWRAETKYKAVLWILGVVLALAGFVAWLVVRNWTLSTTDWMFCFIGYPIVLSWFVVFLYSCRHDFHDGKKYS